MQIKPNEIEYILFPSIRFLILCQLIIGMIGMSPPFLPLRDRSAVDLELFLSVFLPHSASNASQRSSDTQEEQLL